MADEKSEVKVRRMVDADLPRLNEIDQLLKGEGRVNTWPFTFEAYWSVYQPELTYVAEIGDEIVGFLVGYIKPMEGTHSILRRADTQVMPTTRHQMVGWIEMIGVHPDGQNKGVGRQLVEVFDAECHRHDAMINCLVRLDDETLAKFYSSLGFRPWDTVIYFRPWKG
jgi:ribosomal protein S18 acetylase RimI-like enzyme